MLYALVCIVKKVLGRSHARILIDAIRNADIESQRTPRSVSGGDSIYLPKILCDFPEFDAALAKNRIESEICNLFNYISGGGNPLEPLVLPFAMTMKQELLDEEPSGVQIHRSVISGYSKSKDCAAIQFQTAFAYSIRQKNGERILRQERFETEYTYYLTDAALNDHQSGVSLRCSYCGAPVTNTGSKICEYCQSEILVAQDKAWQITEINRK